MVVSDPAINGEQILIVNFTTKRADSDLACVVNKGEHPFVRHETVVSYRGAKVVSATELIR